ncbi:MAG: glycosyltransferase family 4 protein, partial [Acidobacteriota bacterium]
MTGPDRREQSEGPRAVVFVESAGAMGGVQFSTLFLAQRLNRAQWQPVVICPEDGELIRACREVGVETKVLEQRNLRSTSVRIGNSFRLPNPATWAWNGYAVGGASRRLRGFLAESRPALVVTKGLSAHFFGGLAARKLGIPCVWHAQDLISERSLGIYRRAFGRAARWLPTQIIADGASIAEQLPLSLQSRITVVHNGVDTNVFRPGLDGADVRRELGVPADHLVVGHLGRVTPWKGQHYLIEAFARIAGNHPKVTLLLVGAPVFDNDSYQRRLLSLAAQFGLEDRIRFAGYRHDTARVLAAMDVFAFTSVEKDTSPLALLSAMACGLPIVAFDISGVRELMKSDDQFRIVPLGDIAALGRTLAEVISDHSLRQRLGAAARKQAETEFNLDKYVSRIEQVFREALSGARSANVKPVVS